MNLSALGVDNKKYSVGAIAAGAAVGLAAPVYFVYDSVSKLNPQKAKALAESTVKLMPDVDTFEHTKEVASKILEDTGLKSKGVKINFIDESTESLNRLKEVISTETKQTNALGRRMSSNYFETFKEGANAAFFPKANEVVVHSKNLYTSVYHEIGHAMNKNGNIFTKALQKARVITPFGVSVLAPVFLSVGLLHKVDKAKRKEEKSKMVRTVDFVSNNAGQLTLASYLPMLTEEGLASFRGIKEAAKHLSKDVVKGLTKNYARAWGTYAAGAAVISAGVALGIAGANKMREKNSVKSA